MPAEIYYKFITKMHSAISCVNDKGVGYFVKEKIVSRLIDYYWQNKFYLNLRMAYMPLSRIEIIKPIFLLGLQGGGLTILSRMIRRHQTVVYISGNSDYWAGVDEMDKSVKPSMISDDFALRWPQWTKENKPEDNHPVFGYNRGEVYATNTLIQRYRKTVEDYSSEIEKELNGLIKKAIRAYAKDVKCCRFHDMSQTFTLKIPLIRSLLDSPYFILMVRNPYAWCAHHLNNPREHWKWYNKNLSRTEKLIFACEHWTNSIGTAYGDMTSHKDSYIIRLEDFLSDPASRLKDILKFVELDFNEDLLPSPSHKVPLGSRSNTKWYPLKKDVNSKYLSTLSQEDIDLIYQFCGKLASMFNYAKPGQ